MNHTDVNKEKHTMHIVRKRSISDIALGFFLVTHPLPTALFVTTVAIFSLGAMWPHLLWSTFLLLILGHATMQFSINTMNDYCDRYRDAISQPAKPIVRGLVMPREAFIFSILMGIVMVVLQLRLPPLALIVSFGYLALGQSYNLGLKSSIFSGLILALMFALIPLYIFAGVGRLIPIAFWLVPVAFLMGAALNLANSLPDVEGDKKNGARTLAVVLGLRGSFLVCYVFMLLSIALVGVLTITHTVVSLPWVTYPLLALSVLTLLIMNVVFGSNKPVETRRAYFVIVAVMSIGIAFVWFLSAIA
jgi:4-hydroxybenzoate polyprenyltransferase